MISRLRPAAPSSEPASDTRRPPAARGARQRRTDAPSKSAVVERHSPDNISADADATANGDDVGAPVAEPPATDVAEAVADTIPTAFETLALAPTVLANLRHLGYRQMTPIQAATLPLTLAGRDLLAQAQTGSGKTAAFGLPLLERLSPRWFAVQALVLCPTRELADQVAQELRRLARALDNIKVLTLCGGTPMRPQMASLEYGAHVVVGTPGRIIDHLQRESLSLQGLRTLVLDEADRMLDMGFHDDIAWIAEGCPTDRQTMLFSATYPAGIAGLAERFLRGPEHIRLTSTPDPRRIVQRVHPVEDASRLDAVVRVLQHYRPTSTLIFCNTRQRCRDLAQTLQQHGIDALALHGELEQRDRDEVLIQFTHRSCPVLIATDVAARGLDIDALPAVINADIAPDPEVHVHRIGRTGRAEQTGLALSLVSPRDARRIAAIEHLQRSPIERLPLDALSVDDSSPLLAPMVTLQLLGGRKDKLRPADILGALTGELGYRREQIGRITIGDFDSYVAVERSIADQALERLNAGRIKGRGARARRLEPGSPSR